MTKGNLTPENAKGILSGYKEYMSKGKTSMIAAGEVKKANPDMYFMSNVAAHEDGAKAIVMAGLEMGANPDTPMITNVANAEKFKTWMNDGLEKFDAERCLRIVESAEKEIKAAKVIEMNAARGDVRA